MVPSPTLGDGVTSGEGDAQARGGGVSGWVRQEGGSSRLRAAKPVARAAGGAVVAAGKAKGAAEQPSGQEAWQAGGQPPSSKAHSSQAELSRKKAKTASSKWGERRRTRPP